MSIEQAQVLCSSALPAPMEELLPGFSLALPKSGQWGRDELLARGKEASGLISLLSHRVDAELMDAMPRLKVVANYAVGYDNIDLEAATARGIVVTNTPDVLTEATADIAFGLLLSAARRFGEAEAMLRRGEWRGWGPDLLLGYEFFGRTLGVVGGGRIGCALLRRAKGFGMELCYASRSLSEEAERLGARRVGLEELWRNSDFISLHCPLNEGTKEIVDATALGQMKQSAILVNTARGACIDSKALAHALAQGQIAGAGLDVFPDEPRIPAELLSCPNLVLLPHIGSATYQARRRMAEICAFAVRDCLTGKCPSTALNPQVLT